MRLLFGLLLCGWLQAADVTKAHFDAAGTGANTAETKLTIANVTAGKFGLLGRYSVGDSYLWAAPLVADHVAVDGGYKDMVFQAAMKGRIYAWDASIIGSDPVWMVDLATNFIGYPDYNNGSPFLHNQGIGCLSTPVLDRENEVLIASCQNSVGAHILLRISMSDGTVLTTHTTAATYPGTGDPTGSDTVSGGNVQFYGSKQLQRPPLALNGQSVLSAYGGIGDNHPNHGWVLAHDKDTLELQYAFNASPNTGFAAIWQSGHGPAIDADGNSYWATGNGTYDGITAYGDTVLKLSPTLTLEDYFTPINQAAIDAVDADVSSAGPMLTSDGKIIVAAKDFNVYVIDKDCMGGLQGSSLCTLETWNQVPAGTATAFSGTFGGMLMNEVFYAPRVSGKLSGYTRTAGAFNTTPVQTSGTFGMPGASQIAGSSNGTSDGIIWTATASSSSFTTVRAGVLEARKASDLTLLWSSADLARDELGNLSKFSSPVPNGRVYVATQSGYVAVYGLLPAVTLEGNLTITGDITIE